MIRFNRLLSYSLSFSLSCALLAPLPATAQTASTASSATSPNTTTARQVVTASDKDYTRARKGASRITQNQLRKDLTYIASDELGGRDTPSPGLDKAADYIANRMRELKLKPAGDNNTYFQQIELRNAKLDEAKITATLNNQPLTYGTDYVAATTGGTASGNIVFVNHGWRIPAKNIDAYKGVDVRDKIMLVVGGGLPPNVTVQDVRGGKQGVDWSDPATYARDNGARGIMFLQRTPNLTEYFAGRRRIAQRGAFVVSKFEEANTPGAVVPTIYINEMTLAKVLDNANPQTQAVLASIKTPAEIAAFDTAKTANFTVPITTEKVMTRNVVAAVEGTDKKLKAEYVALGAHYDHVGTNPNAPSADKIWNGADDDGSGTVALMSIAEAFAKSRPRRSILFVWHAGEEKGLWGSRYFVENPTVELKNIVTQLNIDMIGRSRTPGDTNEQNANLTETNEVFVIGSRMMSDALGDLSERVNSKFMSVKLNYKYDDVNDTNRFFYRSDHYNYAIKDIPVIFYFSGVHADYHQPGDEVSKIDFPKMELITRTVYMTAAEIANAPQRPRVDRPLPANVRR